MGGCPVPVSTATPTGSVSPNLLPRTAAQAVAPLFSLPFTTNPLTTVSGATGYNWTQSLATTWAANQTLHTGLLTLTGSSNQFINLALASGANSVGQVLPAIGGGDAGWSFEVMMLSTTGAGGWSKLFDLGSTRTNGSNPQNDIFLGWDGNAASPDTFWQFGVADHTTKGNQYQTGDAIGQVLYNTWYHVVAVISATMSNGNANYLLYLNGVLYTTVTNVWHPAAALRQNAYLGKSGWSGDPYFTGAIDFFNVYSQALSDVQVANLYTAAVTPPSSSLSPVVIISGPYVPVDVVVDSQGYIYIADYSNGNGFKLNEVGAILTTYIASPPILQAWGVAVDWNGDVLIVDNSPSNGRVVRFANNGTQLGFISSSSPGLLSPQAVTVDAANNVFLADTNEGVVIKFSPDGTILTTYSTTDAVMKPYGVAVNADGSQVWVADNRNARLVGFLSNGTATEVRIYQTVSPAMGDIHGVALNAQGHLFVSDVANSRVVEFSSNGTQVAAYTLSDPFVPYDLSTDAAGNLYVADAGSQRIVVFLIGEAEALTSSNTCGAFGVNLSATLSGAQLSIESNGFIYYHAPCGGVVSSVPACKAANASSCQVQAIVNGGVESLGVNSGPSAQELWVQESSSALELLGDGSGSYCSAVSANRDVDVVYTCTSAPNASLPLLINAIEQTTCHYQLTVLYYDPSCPVPASNLSVLTTFLFSDAGDGLSCLSSDSTATLGFGGSDGGDIFNWSIAAQPTTVSPAYVLGSGSNAASFIACQANSAGTQLYLVDTRHLQLLRYTVTTPSVPPVVIASFPDEVVGSLSALAVDFTANFAYLATRHTDNLYSVNLTHSGQSISASAAQAQASDISALALSRDGLTLYYGAPAPAEGLPGSINSLAVQAGYIPSSYSPAVLYSSASLIWPDSLLISGSTVYMKDGGPFHGDEQQFTPSNYEELYSFPLGYSAALTTLTTLVRTNSYNLPPGLVLAADQSRLYYLTTSTLNSILLTPPPVAVSSGSLCFLTYSLPGSLDYPWSVSYSLTVTYTSALITSFGSQAVSLLSAIGTRTYTNRFGVSSSLMVQLYTGALANNVHLGSAVPFDVNGLTLTPTASTAVQQPGAGPSLLTSAFLLYNSSNTVLESGSFVIDPLGQAWLSSIPGFLNQSIGASNINSLAPSYGTCQAPLTFTNGLRQPTQPSASNGAIHFNYSYSISDGRTYRVQATLSITTSSAFASSQDAAGNPFQMVTNVAGSRVYTYLPTGQQMTSTILGLASASSGSSPSQRFYPYSLISSAPGVYSINTAPFLDGDGVLYQISPAAPAAGSPLSGSTSTSVQVKVSNPSVGVAVLSELNAVNPPVLAEQQQTYALL